MSSLVAVIVLVHSEQDSYLSQTLESVLQQTHKDFVLYVCCQGSTANVSETVEAYSGKQLTVYLDSYAGSSALGSAVEATDSQYFGWLDSGDILLPGAVGAVVSAINARPNVGVVYTNCSNISIDGLLDESEIVPSEPFSSKKLLTDFIVTQFRLIRRSAYDKVGGINSRLPYYRDYDLVLKLSEISDFFHINKSLFHQRKIERNIGYEEQIERILWSREVAAQALRRRGVAREYELEAELLPRCYLLDKVPTDQRIIQ